ncbi:AraC family transcriptional regulator [Klebsiella quasipneumoniae]|nr:AraC family transcriptional regulator [Klebsiella quasipneumoniae]VGL81789.1 AraC family transcriptional regulator [Klebsiella pneumoniae]VGP73955.1 Right origin-binding protein [Klebsiella quasipneumoniae subsp. quasipneumoniae]SLT72218.1 AraC family transcriptional regulator [Klebsiella quasipneumoniae]SLT73032.1 AraC family transcriptional regulator [Klebsiella quasipneumoniae]
MLMKQMLYLKMLAWLEDNIYCNPAIDDLAQYMGYSRRFVYEVFYQYGRLPIGQYIRLRRLTIAAVSLRLTRQPIAAIAWQLSYDSPQTFSREFKKRFSLSPREYRCAAHWDTAKLLKKFPTDDESLPFARICSLPERVYYGYPMKYELRLSDMVLQSTGKTAIRQKVDRFFAAGGGLLSILSDYAAASQNELNVEVNAFVGCHEARKPSSALTTRSGLYVGVEFYGSWSRYARLSSDLYLEQLPTLGVSRRDGHDIECFMTRHAEGGEAEEKRYHVRYFIPVTLSAGGQLPGSDNELVPAKGTR